MRMPLTSVSISFWVITAAVVAVAIAIGCSKRSRNFNSQPVLPERDPNRYPHFVFAKIMDPVMPMERGDRYEEPLYDTLEARKLGEVTGGGTQMDKEKKIQWVGIDIQLANLDEAVEVVRERLRELGAPLGSVLEFKRGEEKVSIPIRE